MANYVFLGPPGVGKGTMASEMAKQERLAHLSTGDMFRAELKNGTALGRKAKTYMDSGQLVPDELVCDIVADKLEHLDDQYRGFIMDGFPRTVPQAERFDKDLHRLFMPLTGVILMEAPDTVLVPRLTGRRVCRQCGFIAHVVFNPPRKDGVCDICGGEMYQRSDDSEKTVLERLQVYESQTLPLVEYYRRSALLMRVDATGAKDENYQRMVEAIRSCG